MNHANNDQHVPSGADDEKRRLRIARTVDERSLRSLLTAVSSGNSVLELALQGGVRLRIARSVSRAAIRSIVEMMNACEEGQLELVVTAPRGSPSVTEQ